MSSQTKVQRMRRDKPWIWVTLIMVFTLLSSAGIVALVDLTSGNFANGALNILGVSDEDEKLPTPEPERVMPVSASQSSQFVTSLAASDIPGYGIGVAKVNGTAGTVVSWVCGNLTLTPAPAVGAELSFPQQTTAIIHAYGAGQSATALQTYKTGVSKCANRDGYAKVASSNKPYGLDAQGFGFTSTSNNLMTYTNVWVRGDVIISISTPNKDALIDFTNVYDQQVQALLTNTQCLALTVTSEDSTRSPYYNFANYIGWNKGREVNILADSPGVNIGEIPLPATPALVGKGYRLGTVPDGTTKPGTGDLTIQKLGKMPTKPEAPIPADYPMDLPAPVTAPNSAVLPVLPVATPISTVIPERVEDTSGPGCGWAWSGQKAPAYDATAEKLRADGEASTTKEVLRVQYFDFLDKKSIYHNTYLGYSLEVNRYNNYVATVNNVSEKWNYINAKRSEYRTALDLYYSQVAARDKFITDQLAAKSTYDAAVLQCIAQEAAKPPVVVEPTPEPTPEPSPIPTPEPSATPTPVPSPVPTPTPAANVNNVSLETVVEEIACPIAVPEILMQGIPAVPKLPQKPDVPLPAAWTDVP